MGSPDVPLLPGPAELDQSLYTLEKFLNLLGILSAFRRSAAHGDPAVEMFRVEVVILVSRAVVAAVSLLCVSRNLRKYGIRKALFVDRCHGHVTQFRKQYIQRIRVFYWLLASWFVLKTGREVARFMYLDNGSWFRMFLLLEFLFVTASQFVALGIINCVNGGDFAQLIATCNCNDGLGSGNAEVHASGSLPVSCSESDLESADCIQIHTSTLLIKFAVTYVQSNTGGFTIFGWIVDRMLCSSLSYPWFSSFLDNCNKHRNPLF